MDAPIRTLVVAHGHPHLSPGGGEIAAWNQHRALLAAPGHDSVFLARHDDAARAHGGTAFAATGEPREILFRSATHDRFLFSQPDGAKAWRDFREVLDIVRPDVVHFHHYMHLGLELLGEVRRHRSDLPILMTLHEYFAICHASGRMVRTHDARPCERATPVDCARCFPERSPQDFMLRERFVKSWLGLVDRFVAPSRFLAERYADWGIDPGRIEVLENLLEPGARLAPSPTPRPSGAPLRLAYFGQINVHKGVDLLLEALAGLEPRSRERVRLDVHGSGLERQGGALRRRIRRGLRRCGGAARLRGPYRRDELPALMRDADWVVVPSRWWENSPVVILEARRHGVPVICADIGGMAEKVEDGVTGLHFRAGDPASLGARIVDALGHARAGFAERMLATDAPDAILTRHLALHRDLAEAARPGAEPRVETRAA